MGRCAIIEVTRQLFFRTTIKERRFYYEARIKIRRKEVREHLEQLNLACELAKLIRHFFPDLLPLLKQIPDPRNQSYITYPAVLLLMTRILSSLFYISSMRKTSEEFNSSEMIKNIWHLSGEELGNHQPVSGKSRSGKIAGHLKPPLQQASLQPGF